MICNTNVPHKTAFMLWGIVKKEITGELWYLMTSLKTLNLWPTGPMSCSFKLLERSLSADFFFNFIGLHLCTMTGLGHLWPHFDRCDKQLQKQGQSFRGNIHLWTWLYNDNLTTCSTATSSTSTPFWCTMYLPLAATSLTSTNDIWEPQLMTSEKHLRTPNFRETWGSQMFKKSRSNWHLKDAI